MIRKVIELEHFLLTKIGDISLLQKLKIITLDSFAFYQQVKKKRVKKRKQKTYIHG